MDLIAGTSSINRTKNSTGLLVHKMTKGQRDCQNQVREFIHKLSSWRDESHKQMSNIISSHTRSIDMGFNGLVEEFNDLQASDVMIPGVEPVPDYVFSHFLK